MAKRNQSVVRRLAHPLWVRVVATLGLLVFLLASTIQAGHLHGNWFPRNGEPVASSSEWSQPPDRDAGCPLCIAMHSAMPSETKSYTEIVLAVEKVLLPAGNRSAQRLMFFSLFSRPPPAGRIV